MVVWFTAGGVFFESSFGVDYHTGMIVVAGVVVAYTLFGGFLAVCYTDFVQGVIMLLALVFVPVVGLFAVGGFDGVAASINTVDPSQLSMVSGATVLGVISAAAWGLGYVGQPHIIVRFMALLVTSSRQGMPSWHRSCASRSPAAAILIRDDMAALRIGYGCGSHGRAPTLSR